MLKYDICHFERKQFFAKLSFTFSYDLLADPIRRDTNKKYIYIYIYIYI